jgi:hypothetical protein
MKLSIGIAVLTSGLGTIHSPLVAQQRSQAEQFVGSTPCDALPRRFLGIASDSRCERITWRLALSRPGETGQPATYELLAVYGMQAQSAPGFVGGGSAVQVHGTWSRVEGTRTKANAAVYRIRSGPARSVDFVRIGDNLLHLLNEDQTLMIGNPGWSYTLSRDDVTPNLTIARRFETDASAHPNAAGVFEGRTPCQALARQLNVATSSECTKIKWRLTLFQDPATGTPTTYKLEGFVYRNPPRTGQWTIVKDPGANAVVYRLDPDEPGGFLSLIRADDNILFFLDKAGDFLVGDMHYGYTLNRIRAVTRQP